MESSNICAFTMGRAQTNIQMTLILFNKRLSMECEDSNINFSIIDVYQRFYSYCLLEA